MKIKIILVFLVFISSVSAKDIEMQSIYSDGLPLLADLGVELPDRVSTLTGGSLNINYRNPGEIVTPNQVWDAVSTGAIEAAWYTPGFADGIIPASVLFSSFPFGPDADEYLAWWYSGGGRELWLELSAPFNIHSELCSILTPEAGGWFREEINSPEDLRDKKIRAFGLMASVLQEMGVSAQSLSISDTMTALNLGTIDAAEVSFPLLDEATGMFEYADYYYFPGWHQPSTFIVFMMNTDVWNTLTEQERSAITEVCTANVTRALANGNILQADPIERMVARGVEVREWSEQMMSSFEEAWLRVLEDKLEADPDFKRVWEHIKEFRAKYKSWIDLGHME